ncbi:hypothetical protein N4P33_27250 [Streptomyces sp. 15-116A]|uniref:hypothetical protein n=1 Tax=Streptomyces sp. 15-116A TaxID=2259035 RepID=UPI0021B26FDA|nr:hypothetical protein [Streptomyces sp. 15-116A]MCT7355822.1 hypothetical protein [Streptomyces sp. 15-116A]
MLRDPYAVMRALLRAEAARNGTHLPPRTDRPKPAPKKPDTSKHPHPAHERSRD